MRKNIQTNRSSISFIYWTVATLDCELSLFCSKIRVGRTQNRCACERDCESDMRAAASSAGVWRRAIRLLPIFPSLLTPALVAARGFSHAMLERSNCSLVLRSSLRSSQRIFEQNRDCSQSIVIQGRRRRKKIFNWSRVPYYKAGQKYVICLGYQRKALFQSLTKTHLRMEMTSTHFLQKSVTNNSSFKELPSPRRSHYYELMILLGSKHYY